MIDSIDWYYQYRTFDGSIKNKNSFLTRIWAFFYRHGKKTAKIRRIFLTVWSIDRYYRFSVYRWFDGHRSEKAFMIDCRYYRSTIRKSLTDGSITSMKMRPKVSIDSIDRYYRYRSIDPSPIVPIYAARWDWWICLVWSLASSVHTGGHLRTSFWGSPRH